LDWGSGMTLTHANEYAAFVKQVDGELKRWRRAEGFWHVAYGVVALLVIVGPVLVGLSTVPWPQAVTIALGAIVSVVAVLERAFGPGRVWMDYESDAQSLAALGVDISDPPDNDAQLDSIEREFKKLQARHVEHTKWWVLGSTKAPTGNPDTTK
jgi:hypothetical protein